ncbi:putative replication initiation protein [Fiddler Crab associated circular virus]|uniref:putative replication initiation protein n=1 Tax=Fiddler Crab associated circular virus TaxID=1692249 RepID=UPI0006A732B6|nr:putative replication initiation protein [Fiddler Crab associated circular virus]AKV62281.1 putative replication initiation protein [Fiddler Crab associated circular virus]
MGVKLKQSQDNSEGGNNHPPSFRSRKLVFTLNNYQKEDINLIISYFESSAQKWVFGEEVGESGTPHLQGYCEFKNQKEWKQITDKCSPLKRAWSTSARGSLDDNVKYTTKDGKIYYGGFKIEKCNYKVEIDLYDWQKEIMEILEQTPDDRTIHWVWEPKGGIGKTTFQKYIFTHMGGVCVLSGKGSDMKHGVVSYINDHGETPDIVLINIPRSSAEFVSWSGIEEIKDMFFYSGKYEGGQVCGMSPHVLVFANTEPPEGVFSKDRVKTIELDS